MTDEKLTQANYIDEQAKTQGTGPVTCLGMEFADDEARRAHFTERLREYLQDPAFRAIEGFPIGDDEAILALSDPPYYTACPNPFLPQIMAEWQQQRAALHAELGLSDDDYHREPFAADVSEGKNDPIYNAHSYHTKVPHKAIMRYILHYTEPGDIVFDGFCGSGMTGVAAQLCGDRKAVQELGYRVDNDGTIYDGEQRIGRLGARKAVLNDLSPAATFIAYNYNTPVDVAAFEREARRILDEVEDELGWMYETWHPNCDDPNRVKANVNYFVCSDIYSCPVCGTELLFWDLAVDPETRKVNSEYVCPSCRAELKRRSLEPATITEIDAVSGDLRQTKKSSIVLINYTFAGEKIEKAPDRADLDLLEQIMQCEILDWHPIEKMLFRDGEWGDQWRQGYHSAVHRVDHFFSKRNLLFASRMYRKVAQAKTPYRAILTYWFQSVLLSYTSLNRYLDSAFSQVNRYRSGTLYIPALRSEISPAYSLTGKLSRIATALAGVGQNWQSSVSNGSSTNLTIPQQMIDYVFVDPPFGSNLAYSELNFIWESWLRVFTSNRQEAIVSDFQHKALVEYQRLMHGCFEEFYRVLRFGSWITVEFHNSQNSVWRAIQEGLQKVGFIVADVRTFDKQQGTFNQVTAGGAVKQDLIISAYKPTAEFEQSFSLHAGTESGVWDFVRQHLAQLPRVVRTDLGLETIAERQNFLLFDRMVAYHIQQGVVVPMGSAQFYAGLKQRFVERDSMYFLPEQVAEYDRARLEADTVEQIALFVNDEKSAITWLRILLDQEPLNFQDIQPRFLRELHQARHEDLPDLRVLLEQNFLLDDEGRYYVPDPANAEDLEKLRLRSLLQEFATYRESRKKLKTFRTEAVRAGFAQAYADNDFAVILQVAALLPESVIQEDPDLLMYVDAASLRE